MMDPPKGNQRPAPHRARWSLDLGTRLTADAAAGAKSVDGASSANAFVSRPTFISAGDRR